MRSVHVAAFLAALALAATACNREVTTKSRPVVLASADMELAVRESVVLGASSPTPSTIHHYDWTLVSSPASDRASIDVLSNNGDVAVLHTQNLPGLYVVAVTATDGDGLESEPDFVNITLWPKSLPLQIALSCTTSCRQVGGQLETNELDNSVFTLQVVSGNPTELRWTVTLERDARDPLTDVPTVLDGSGHATVVVPRVSFDATLNVHVTASAPGVGDAVADLAVIVKNTTDEPPTVSLEWKIPGGLSVPDHVLPGDAVYVTARVADPNGDAVSCSFAPGTTPAVTIKTTSDPCRIILFPRAGGTLTVGATAITASPAAQTAASPLQIAVSDFVLEAAGGASLTSVALTGAGQVIATSTGSNYFIYDATAATPVATSFTSALTGPGAAVAISPDPSGDLALLGFAGSPKFAEYRFGVGTLADLSFNPANVAARSNAMVQGSNGKVWMAMDQGLGFFDPLINLPLQWLPVGGLTASAIAWGPSPRLPASDGYLWYADRSDVYCQTGEDPTAWPATGKGNLAGTVQHPYISGLSFGTARTWDLWVATAPTGGINTGFGLLLYKDAVDPATGNQQMNAGQELFAQEEGGVLSVAVERDGAYESDAWAVAGGKVVRVSRAPVDDVTGATAGVVDLVIQTAFDTKAKAVAVVGRRVVVATSQGLAVLK